MQLKRFLFFLILVYSCFYSTVLQAKAPTNTSKSSTKPLIVGISLTGAPFTFLKDSVPTGIAIEIWEEVAEEGGWEYIYKPFESVNSALDALKKGSIDAVVGPISITSNRLENARFSQPFYNSSLAIVSRVEELSLWEKIKPLFSLQLLGAILVFVFILATVGTFLWLAERKKSPEQFPSDPLYGIGDGMWLAIVTMTTTGYGDKAPITLAGRIITGTWMVISIIFATSMVAGIASTLTVSSLEKKTIHSIEQLSGGTAASVIGSPAISFLKDNQIKTVGVTNLNEAIKLLKDKKVDAVVYDRPELLYMLRNRQEENLYIAKSEYYKHGYGFAFPRNTMLIYDVNRALLGLSETQRTERILTYYLDNDK